MAGRAPAPISLPPLLIWREMSEAARLAAECRSLTEWAAKLRPHCHKRLELEMRLRALRARQLAIETGLRRWP